MQLLDRTIPQASTLTDVLLDIATNVHIGSDFRIIHPHYKPFELAQDAIERFQQLPAELQTKYLSLQLRSFLYGVYYNGSMRKALALDADKNTRTLSQNLENNTMLGVNLQFYEQLHNSNRGTGYFDPGWQVIREEDDGNLAVKKNDLTLHLDRDLHLQPEARNAQPGDTVAIKMPKNFVQNGFYMAVSNYGHDSRRQPAPNQTTVRVYFNLTPEGAVAVMADLTEQLNSVGIPFTFKALYNPEDYNRHDSAVLYFSKSNYERVHPVLKSIHATHAAAFCSDVPLFTKQIASGLAIAEEPDQKFAAQESFGMNRCQIVSYGLLVAQQKGEHTPTSRLNAILQQFEHLQLNAQRPYLNANSGDIYTCL